ncbi:hypothetical protein F5B19DRAFT_448548 [Rostrohypoxylon terebratum]|nr:hypothetical protein F5B19DRAFT_448548 [Rostrohypoxylon terebratum]
MCGCVGFCMVLIYFVWWYSIGFECAVCTYVCVYCVYCVCSLYCINCIVLYVMCYVL